MCTQTHIYICRNFIYINGIYYFKKVYLYLMKKGVFKLPHKCMKHILFNPINRIYSFYFKLVLNSFNKIDPITIFSQFTQTSNCSASMNFIVTNTNDLDAKV